MYIDTPVTLRIVKRGEFMEVLAYKIVEITRVKPDFDGKGVEICIEESVVENTEWKET
jgi:hypothetical protein